MKKSLSMLMLISLGISAFTGCRAADTQTPLPEETTPEVTQPNVEETEATEEEITGIAFPLEEPVEFTFHYHAKNKFVFNEEWPVYKKLAEITNISLKNTANEVATNSIEQLQLQAVDGFPSDIYGGNNLAPYFMQYGQEGAFVPINEYWDYLPNFRKFLDENPDVEASITAPDGNIYHIPYIQGGGSIAGRTYHIRTDWLEKLGLEVPTTTEELEEVFTAFKTQDPNGNGRADEIPYFNDSWYDMMRLVNLWDARAYSMDSYQERVIPREDGTVYHAWTQPEFKEAIKNLSRWYDNGLIDKEIFTKGNASRKEYLPKDIGGMTHEWVASTSAYNYKVEVDGFKFESMLPPVTANGNQWEEHERLKVKPDGWALSSNCDQPEIALAYMDYFYSEKGRILSNFGVEGLTYTMVDGKPTFTEEVLNGEKAVNAFLEEEIGAQLKQGYWLDYNYEYQWTSEIGREGVELYSSVDLHVPQMPPLSYTTEQKDIMDKNLVNINSYMDENVQKWIIGDPSLIDQEWDQYLAELETLGLQELLDAYQEAYTTYLERLGE